jgi:hypothetical protein
VTAVVLLLWPILTAGYDYRYVIPAFGPLGAAGALAGWGLAVRIGPRWRLALSRARAEPRKPRDPRTPEHCPCRTRDPPGDPQRPARGPR